MAFCRSNEPPYKRGRFEPEQDHLRKSDDPLDVNDNEAFGCSLCGSSDHSEQNCFYSAPQSSNGPHICTFQDDNDIDNSYQNKEDNGVTYAAQPPVGKFISRWCSICASSDHFEDDCCYNQPHTSNSVQDNYEDDDYSIASIKVENDEKDDQPNRNTPLRGDGSPISMTNTDVACDLDENQTEIIKDENNNIWYVNSLDYHKLFGEGVKIFLTTLEEKVNVSVDVKKKGAETFVCILKGGSTENKHEAMSAIGRYCAAIEPLKQYSGRLTLIRKFTDMKVVQKNLAWFDADIDWFYKCERLYKVITDTTKTDLSTTTDDDYKRLEHTLKRLYAKLNTIIIVKLQIDKAKVHMDILRHGAHDKKIIEDSFNYVFNSERILYPNYNELISKLPRMQRKTRTNNHCHFALENMKKTAHRLCCRSKLQDKTHHLNYLYALVIIYDYADSYVKGFNNEARRLKNICKKMKNENKRMVTLAKKAAKQKAKRKF